MLVPWACPLALYPGLPPPPPKEEGLGTRQLLPWSCEVFRKLQDYNVEGSLPCMVHPMCEILRMQTLQIDKMETKVVKPLLEYEILCKKARVRIYVHCN